MVFLVDRVPLVYQQSEYIRSQVPKLRVMMLVGEMESSQQKAVHQALANQEVDVLVLTHQIFLNFLAIEKNPIVRLSDISVLVFDEAHHCRGRHQYNQIMDYYHVTANKFKPIVLGVGVLGCSSERKEHGGSDKTSDGDQQAKIAVRRFWM